MATKTIILHTNARVNGVLRSPPEGEIKVNEGEAKRLVNEEKVAKLAPGQKWTPARAAKPAAAPKKATKGPAPAPADAPTPDKAPASTAGATDQPQG